MGNNCRVSLEGTCRTVKVYGNGNVVLVDTAVRAIHTLGERNTVSWSTEQNPTAPRVTNLGGGNKVEAAGGQ
jgi:hypothetical protein